MMLHSMFRYFMEQGHECFIVLASPFIPTNLKDYEHEGVFCTVSLKKLWEADVVITHLDNTVAAEGYCRHTQQPLVHLCHNEKTLKAFNVLNENTCAKLVVANSNWVGEEYRKWWKATPVLVCHPPVWEQDYLVEPGEAITLINVSPAKGADLFYEMAAARPDLPFLAVQGGYGMQVFPPDLPNLSYWPTQRDARRIFEQTKVITMPSTYESWGRCAMEASVSGIPCLAADTPGLREALETYGVFPDAYTVEAWLEALDEVLGCYDFYAERARLGYERLRPEEELDSILTALENIG